jgi:hypothetical protein
MVVLRQFLYRDDELVLQFLAQLEGGTYDEELVTEQNQSGGAFGGGVGAGPAKLSAERKKQGSWEASRTVRQTDESRFNRLHMALEERTEICAQPASKVVVGEGGHVPSLRFLTPPAPRAKTLLATCSFTTWTT